MAKKSVKNTFVEVNPHLVYTDEIDEVYDGGKIKDGTVTSRKIADNAVTSSKIANNAVTNEKLANGSVSVNKLSDGFVGSGLEIESDTLSIDLTDEAAGESITAADASYFASLTVDGKAVQDGTPTPDAPVEIDVVEGANILDLSTIKDSSGRTHSGLTWTVNADGTISVSGTSTASSYIRLYTNDNPGPIVAGGTYTISGGGDYIQNHVYDGTNKGSANPYTWTAPNPLPASWNISYFVSSGKTVNATINPQIEVGSTATPYVPYGSIGLEIGSTVTPIDLQGNVLASLPDGTRDVLTVDSVGHCVLTKTVSHIASYNGESVGSVYVSTTGQLTTGAEVYYKTSSTSTIDLGYIDMPAIPDGAEISITAQVTPTISASWWARGAAAVAEALKAVRDILITRIEAIEEAIADL